MKKTAFLKCALSLLAAGFLCCGPFTAYGAQQIPDGVYAAGESLGGLTVAEAEKKINEYVDSRKDQVITIKIDEKQASTSAGELGLSWSNKDEFEEDIEALEPRGNLIKRYMQKKDIELDPVTIDLEMTVDEDDLRSFVSASFWDDVTEPVNAAIKRENGTFVITPGAAGEVVDPETTTAAISAALDSGETGEIVIEAGITTREPDITEDMLSTITDVLGTFSTDFSSSGASRATNVQVGTSKINGTVLMPGEMLSGYELMHPFTESNGYKTAIAYENGMQVDSVGGGVCQISTTLYNASLLAELDIIERHNHSMTISYVKASMDAAIAGTYKDLKVSNPYDTPIYIEGYTSGRTLTFTIYGKETRPSNRKIEFESVTLTTTDPGAPTEELDYSLAPGQRVQVQSSHTGKTSQLYKNVYVDGVQTEHTLLNNDTYQASKAIYRVGPAASTEEAVPEITEIPEETVPEVQPVSPAETEAPAETTAASKSGIGPGYTDGPGAEPETAASPAAAEVPAETEAQAPAVTEAQPAEASPAGPGAQEAAGEAYGPGMTEM